jgi:4-aminobutyrate aminotransferase
VRGVGLCLALELTGPAAEANADRLLYACLGRGLSFKLGAGRIVTLCPPLTIEQAQFNRAIDVIEAAAHEIA